MVHSFACGCVPSPPASSCRSCSSASSCCWRRCSTGGWARCPRPSASSCSESLSQRAREFADDFDGEITRLYLALQAAGRPVRRARARRPSPAALDAWRATARFPQIARAVYLAEPDGETLHACGRTIRLARAFSRPLDAWPATSTPLRDRLSGGRRVVTRTAGSGDAQFIAISPPPLLPEIPALVIPVAAPLAGIRADQSRRRRAGSSSRRGRRQRRPASRS